MISASTPYSFAASRTSRANSRLYVPSPTTVKPNSSAATRAAAIACVASPNTNTRLPVR